MDMTELMKPYEDRFQTGMLNSYTIGGRLWGFPFSSSGTVTFYHNKDMFDELGIEEPDTYDELVEICKIIKEKKDIIPIIQQGQKTSMWPMWYMEAFAQTSGNQSEQFTVDFLSGKRNFTEEPEIEAFRLLKKFVDDGL